MDNDIKFVKYKIVESIDPRLVEVVVSFVLDGEQRSHYIFLNKKEGTPKESYLKKAEEKFKKDLEAGKINDARVEMVKERKKKHVLLFFFFFTLIAALSMVGLFTYQYFTSTQTGGDTPLTGEVSLKPSTENCKIYIGEEQFTQEKIIDLSTTPSLTVTCKANDNCSFREGKVHPFTIDPANSGVKLEYDLSSITEVPVTITFNKNHTASYTFKATAMQVGTMSQVDVKATTQNCEVKGPQDQEISAEEYSDDIFFISTDHVCTFKVLFDDQDYKIDINSCIVVPTWKTEPSPAVNVGCSYENHVFTVDLKTAAVEILGKLDLTVIAVEQ